MLLEPFCQEREAWLAPAVLIYIYLHNALSVSLSANRKMCFTPPCYSQSPAQYLTHRRYLICVCSPFYLLQRIPGHNSLFPFSAKKSLLSDIEQNPHIETYLPKPNSESLLHSLPCPLATCTVAGFEPAESQTPC